MKFWQVTFDQRQQKLFFANVKDALKEAKKDAAISSIKEVEIPTHNKKAMQAWLNGEEHAGI